MPLLRICSFVIICLLIGNPSLTKAQDSDLTPVTLQLRWFHQFQFAGYYAAIEKGFYRDAGLAVTIREGGVKLDTIKEVSEGSAQYGVTNSEILLHFIHFNQSGLWVEGLEPSFPLTNKSKQAQQTHISKQYYAPYDLFSPILFLRCLVLYCNFKPSWLRDSWDQC